MKLIPIDFTQEEIDKFKEEARLYTPRFETGKNSRLSGLIGDEAFRRYCEQTDKHYEDKTKEGIVGVDFILNCLWKVDVKTRVSDNCEIPLETYNMAVPKKVFDISDTDFYVGVWYCTKGTRCYLTGHISKKMFNSLKSIAKKGDPFENIKSVYETLYYVPYYTLLDL